MTKTVANGIATYSVTINSGQLTGLLPSPGSIEYTLITSINGSAIYTGSIILTGATTVNGFANMTADTIGVDSNGARFSLSATTDGTHNTPLEVIESLRASLTSQASSVASAYRPVFQTVSDEPTVNPYVDGHSPALAIWNNSGAGSGTMVISVSSSNGEGSDTILSIFAGYRGEKDLIS